MGKAGKANSAGEKHKDTAEDQKRRRKVADVRCIQPWLRPAFSVRSCPTARSSFVGLRQQPSAWAGAAARESWAGPHVLCSGYGSSAKSSRRSASPCRCCLALVPLCDRCAGRRGAGRVADRPPDDPGPGGGSSDTRRPQDELQSAYWFTQRAAPDAFVDLLLARAAQRPRRLELHRVFPVGVPRSVMTALTLAVFHRHSLAVIPYHLSVRSNRCRLWIRAQPGRPARLPRIVSGRSPHHSGTERHRAGRLTADWSPIG
jgi:hypothetical protein